MSTLAVGTIKSISSAAPVFQNTSGTEKGQLAKAWLNLCGGVDGLGSSYGIRDSFNISSVTDTATGRYTVNLATSMSNTNYCPVSSGHYLVSASGNVREVGATSLATGSYVLEVSYNGGTLQDANNVFSAVFGDN